MSENITGKISGIGQRNRLAIDQIWYQLNEKCAKYLKYYKIGDPVSATPTGVTIENEGKPIQELGFIKKGEFTAENEQINTVPLGNLTKPTINDVGAKRDRSMSLSYAKDLMVARMEFVAGYRLDIPELLDVAEQLYKFIAHSK